MLQFFRPILATIAGYLVMFVVVILGDALGYWLLDTSDPGAGYMLYLLLWNLPAGLAGGWVAAWLGADRPMRHAGYLAGLVLFLGVGYLLTAAPIYEEQGITLPAWYLPMLPVTGVAGVLLGGYVRARRKAA